MKHLIHIAVLLYSLYHVCVAKVHHIERKITSHEVHTVQCAGNTTHDIVHIEATNTEHKNDVMHYLFTSINRPTIVIKHTTVKTTVMFNDDSICNQTGGEAFTFDPNGNVDISGVIISKVFPYNDKPDLVSLQGLSPSEIFSDIAHDFKWQFQPKKKDDDFKFMFKGTSKKHENASLDFSVDVQLKTENVHEPPRNPVHANLTEFRFDMLKLPANFSAHPRYAIEVLFFGTGKKSGAARYSTIQYIDDEFTPGNFQIWSINFPLINDKKDLFTSWKPVAYNSKDRGRESLALAKNYNMKGQLGLSGSLEEVGGKDSVWSVVSDVKDVQFFGMNITFGLAKDGCYNNNPYMSWTGMVGYDKTPEDSISSLVIIVISVGIGAPAVFILVGVLVLLIRKVKFSKNSYDPIQ